MKIIITSPSLNPLINVSGISSITQFIINNNKVYSYVHFLIGKKDKDGIFFKRIYNLVNSLIKWVLILINNKNDILIHYNFPLSTFSILRDSIFILLSLFFQKKIILHIHGGKYLMNSAPPYFINLILKQILQRKIPIIVLSEMERAILIEKYGCGRVISLPNCVSIEECRYDKINRLELNILFLGRIDVDKGLDYILESAIQLKRQRIPFKLHIAGEEAGKGEYINRFKSLLGNETFIYHGIVVGEQKKELFKQSEIFLLPSFYEGLPMSLLEAMSFGLVPIVTNVGSIGTIVKNAENGIIIKDHNSTEISDAIVSLSQNSDLRKRLAIKARETIINHFDASNYVDQLNRVYKMA